MTARVIALVIAGSICAAAAHAADGDSASGANVFAGQCSICHSVKEGKNKVGPSLAGVIGRPAGALHSFTYSDAMRNSGVTWTAAMLNAYLANPNAMIPGSKMPYQGLADEKARWDLIAYLSAQSSNR